MLFSLTLLLYFFHTRSHRRKQQIGAIYGLFQRTKAKITPPILTLFNFRSVYLMPILCRLPTNRATVGAGSARPKKRGINKLSLFRKPQICERGTVVCAGQVLWFLNSTIFSIENCSCTWHPPFHNSILRFVTALR